MKKFICYIAIAFLLTAGFTMFETAKVVAKAATPTITVETVTAHSGNEVQVPITVTNNPGICAALIAVSYGDGLELIGVDDQALLPNPVHGGDLGANPYLLSWDDSLAETDITQNGTLVILRFRVQENATPENCGITVHYEQDNIFNLSLENVHFETVDGKVEVAGNIQSDSPEERSPIVIILCVLAALLLAAGVFIVLKRKKATKDKVVSAEGGEGL